MTEELLIKFSLSFTLSQICVLAGVKTTISKLVGKGMALPVFSLL